VTRPLALTIGEPAGIGPDITIAAWLRRREAQLPPFYLIGDIAFMRGRAGLLGADVTFAEVTAAQAIETFASALPVIPTGDRITARAGHPDATSAPAAIAAIRRAVADVTAGHASAVVTNPIAKSVLYRAGFSHPGHTEFLAELASHDGVTPLPVMMLWSPTLAVVPVTIHVPLRTAIDTLTTDMIVRTCRVLVTDLTRRFGLPRPRIALAGLNPHAGEDGTIGHEDQTVIVPAVEILRREGLDVRGPLPADTMFHEAARRTYDCAVGMYHDQALIPLKTLAFDDGVNATLGLPFIRTSPDHGTAFDIAGSGNANPSSLIAALKLAARMSAAAGTA
jgi:4-hydroxythreonine-4-phosphate dehydrogenase